MLIYNQSLALLTDLYQLTMAYGYWKTGAGQQESVFHLFFRKNPFNGGFSLACGLNTVVSYLENFRFDESDVEYLGTLTGTDGNPLFESGFLDYLRDLKFTCDIDAIPEGTVVFPNEPLIRVKGPIIQCQILETPLLNITNFQTLIATKAARMCIATGGEPVLEFGLRRAQGIDGGLAASRAAYIGGCAATSNVLAGKIFNIPVKGTHAHSWVMSFDQELEAFKAYAEAMPNNCVFLVDTYDTLEGVKHAIEVGHWLRTQGHEMIGIRLDSGDLAYLSIEARKLLDEGGFPNATIVASNDLDETIISSLKQQGAKIGMWGVGTKLITGYDQPALGGVYKLSAVRSEGGEWVHKVKLSEQSIKISNPGIQQVRRYYTATENIGDAIYDVDTNLSGGCTIVDPMDPTRMKKISADVRYRDLLVPVFRNGQCVYNIPTIEETRSLAAQELTGFHYGVKRFVNPHAYPVGLEKSLHTLKTELVLKARGVK
ncbi:MAG: nicotinate phosphoribosyltransferase [Blastocatellia bacterium]|nr:nicotinate phosphoribosyltransferase [Blastocatellia bacterium]